MDVVMSKKMSDKISALNKSNNARDRRFLRNFKLSISELLQGNKSKAKKVLNTDNIYIFKLGSRYRVFYTIERNSSGEEVILLIDYFDKTEYKNKHEDILEEIEKHNKVY